MGGHRDPGYLPLGYAGEVTDATRIAQALQDQGARYRDLILQPLGVRTVAELPAGPSTTDVILEHDLGTLPSFVLPGIEAPGQTLGAFGLSVQERGATRVMIRVETNLGAPVSVELIAILLP